MYRNGETGYWEEDFRHAGIPRLHLSYGVKRKADAEPASAAMHRLFREKRTDLIERVRRGETTPFEVAAAIADDRPLGGLGAVAAAVTPWLTLRAAADDYLSALLKSDRKAKGTAEKAKAELERFIRFAGAEVPVDSIDSERVLAYQRYLYSEGLAQNTVVAYVWRVSGLYTWLVKRETKDARREHRPERVLHIPIDPDEVAQRQTHRDRWLTEDEAERLIAASPRQLLAPIMLGLFAGLRVQEALHLRPRQDIDLSLGLITIQEQPTWHPKNRKRRVVPIAPPLRPVLEYHLANYASETWLMPSPVFDDRPITFDTFHEHFTRIVEDSELVSGRADPRGVVFHTLRHTFASWLVMRGVDLYTLSQLLGNTLAVVEKTYAHLAPDFRQRAVDRLAGVVAVAVPPQPEGATE